MNTFTIKSFIELESKCWNNVGYITIDLLTNKATYTKDLPYFDTDLNRIRSTNNAGTMELLNTLTRHLEIAFWNTFGATSTTIINLSNGRIEYNHKL